MNRRTAIEHPCCLLLPLLIGTGSGEDWTSWRGPHADGTSAETDWDPEALREPRIRWTASVGTGHGAVVVRGSRLYAMGNYSFPGQQAEDVVTCLDTDTGEEIWAHVYPCAEKEDPGPCSTPLLADGRLYTVSREGHFLCLDIEEGEVLWQHQLVEENLSREHDYFASSPVLAGELVVLNLNQSGIAFDRKSGRLAWNSEFEEEAFSTPVAFSFASEELLAIQSMDALHAVKPGDGEVVWQLDREAVPDPIFLEDRMLSFSSRGLGLFRLTEREPEPIWTSDEWRPSFQGSVIVEDNIYGFLSDGDEATLSCLSLETGALQWRTAIEEGALIAAGDKLIVLDQQGKLIIAQASAERFEELSSRQAIALEQPTGSRPGHRREHSCWTNPVLSHGHIYVRSTYGELACLDVRRRPGSGDRANKPAPPATEAAMPPSISRRDERSNQPHCAASAIRPRDDRLLR